MNINKIKWIIVEEEEEEDYYLGILSISIWIVVVDERKQFCLIILEKYKYKCGKQGKIKKKVICYCPFKLK
jgi:hypothetical protein